MILRLSVLFSTDFFYDGENNDGTEAGSSSGKSEENAAQPFFCTECNTTFVKLKDLQDHISESKHDSPLNGKCLVCGDVLRGHLRQHIWGSHLKVKPYKCRFCNYRCVYKFRVYKDHYKSKHGNGSAGKPKDVELVPEDVEKVDAFEKKHNLHLGPPLYKEMGRHENETSVVECHLCDSTFTQKSSLRQHLWAVHLKKKPYKCKHCDFVGAYKRLVISNNIINYGLFGLDSIHKNLHKVSHFFSAT